MNKQSMYRNNTMGSDIQITLYGCCEIRQFFKNVSNINMSNEIIHDFRPDSLKWGWNGLSFDLCADKKTAVMIGIGRGIESGHFIALRQGSVDYAYKVLTVEYDTNPKDLFKATIKICGTIED